MSGTTLPIVPVPIPNIDLIPDNTSTNVTIPIIGTPSASGTSSSVINYPFDHDWFKVDLRAGELYQFEVNTPLPTSFLNPTLAVHNSAGTQVAFNNDKSIFDRDSLVQYRAPTTGTYYLDVGGSLFSTGAYTVVAREVPASTSTYASTSLNQSVLGDIQDAADQDWYRINLTAGQTYNFYAIGSSLTGGLADPTLGIRNSAGTQLAFNDNFGGSLNSHVTFTPASSGAYYIDVGGTGVSSGQYTLIT